MRSASQCLDPRTEEEFASRGASDNRTEVGSPDVAIDGAGTVTAVWRRQTDEARQSQIETRRRVAGVWQPVERLSPAERTDIPGDHHLTTDLHERPHVAVNAGGDTIVIWEREETLYANAGSQLQSQIYGRVRPAGGTWGLQETGAYARVAAPAVALTDAGVAGIGWRMGQYDLAADRVYGMRTFALRRATDGTRGATVALSPSWQPDDAEWSLNAAPTAAGDVVFASVRERDDLHDKRSAWAHAERGRRLA